jgi:hypothetical protein
MTCVDFTCSTSWRLFSTSHSAYSNTKVISTTCATSILASFPIIDLCPCTYVGGLIMDPGTASVVFLFSPLYEGDALIKPVEPAKVKSMPLRR